VIWKYPRSSGRRSATAWKGLCEADNEEGWVLVPDISGEKIENLEKMHPSRLGKAREFSFSLAKTKKIRKYGEVKFAVFVPQEDEKEKE